LRCDAINNANTLLAISMVMRAKVVQQCNYNIVRVLWATVYISRRVIDCGLRSESIVGASIVWFSVINCVVSCGLEFVVIVTNSR
jgi:hypothetical protein